MTDVARALIDKLETLRTPSAAVMRASVYRQLAGLGLDVDRLRRDACLDMIAEQEAKVARARTNKGFHELRLEALKARLKTFSHVPTRELVRHKGEAPVIEEFDIVDGKPEPLRTARHRWEWPVDRIRHIIAADHYNAAERYRWAYETSQGNARIGDYGDGSGRSDPARRLALTPEQERAGRIWNVMNININPAVRLIAWNFILELPPRGWERPLTAVEFGHEYGRTTNESRARGITEGALITACAVLSDVNRGYEEWLKGRNRPQPLNENERKMLEKWERRK
jgi:hypothetical protein